MTVSVIAAVLVLVLLIMLIILTEKHAMLKTDGWEKGVANALNSFILTTGKHSSDYDGSAYAVFDFDDSTAIFDVSDQLAIYQLMYMAFTMEPEELKDAITISVPEFQRNLSDYGYPGCNLNDWVTDIFNAYAYLYAKYGPFSQSELSEADASAVRADPMWMEFAVKMRAMYDLVNSVVPTNDGDTWITHWFCGMTEEDVYALARAACDYYMKLDTSIVTWTSSAEIDSVVGQVSYKWISGLSVTENIRELMRVLRENGIDVWICSGSFADVIRAAIDSAGIHDYVTGVLGMVDCKDADGRYICKYDYETGCGWLSEGNGKWKQDSLPLHARPHREGKTDAINNTLVKKYGHGPYLGMMDSTGDFYFCTEFQSLKLVVCMNRADRSVRNGGGLLGALALYQRDVLKYNLKKANDNHDTLYVLQGRDENGIRTLRKSNASIKAGCDKEKLFMNEENRSLLNNMNFSGFSTEEAINAYSRLTPTNSKDNPLGFEYGFLTVYRGYHSFK